MTERERLHKNAACDLLMKEGLDGWQDEENVARVGLLTDLAVELGRKDSLACALAWFEALEQKGFCGELAVRLDYCKASAIAGERYGTKWQWEQPTLAREMFHLRRAVSHQNFAQMSDRFRCVCLNNLGKRLCVAGRVIEALDSWRRVLEVQPHFGMALCNRASTWTAYAEALEDAGQKVLFFWMAHKEASAALAATALYTDVHDKATLAATKRLKERIESVVDVEGITKLDPLKSQDTSATEEEREYRRWCLDNCLYLNPLNDLGQYTVANYDSMGLGTHVVRVDAPHIFGSFFDQMKQEYVSARWLLYEGLSEKLPHFSDREVLLGATEPGHRCPWQSKKSKPPTGFPILFSTKSASL